METNKSDVFNLGTAQGYSNLEILEAAKKLLALTFLTLLDQEEVEILILSC